MSRTEEPPLCSIAPPTVTVSSIPPSGLSVLIRVRLELRRHQRAGHTIPCIFQSVAQRQPERLALVDAGSGARWTFARLDAYANAVANLFRQRGFGPGDVVALFLEGRPEFVGLWLGLAKAGVEAALLNVNLRREPLAFCLGTSGAKALVFGAELAEGEVGTGGTRGPGGAPGPALLSKVPPWFCPAAVAEVSAQLGKSLVKFCAGEPGPEGRLPDTQLLDPLLVSASTEPPAQPPGKGMDGEWVWGTPGDTQHPAARIPPRPDTVSAPRSALLHLHLGDHGAAQGRYRCPQQVRGSPALPRLPRDGQKSEFAGWHPFLVDLRHLPRPCPGQLALTCPEPNALCPGPLLWSRPLLPSVLLTPRYYRIAAFGHHAYSMREADVLYDCLPLYHSAGGAQQGRAWPGMAVARVGWVGAPGSSPARPPQGTSWAWASASCTGRPWSCARSSRPAASGTTASSSTARSGPATVQSPLPGSQSPMAPPLGPNHAHHTRPRPCTNHALH